MWKKNGLGSTDISLDAGFAINTLTNMIDKMEMENLIYPKNSDAGKRKICVSNRKRKIIRSKIKIATDKMGEIFYKDFTAREIEIFEDMLRKIISNLEDEDDK